jgi:thiol:disulfide interchange protein DsbA
VKFIKRILVVLAMLCATQAMAADRGYTQLNPAQTPHSGNKVEVLEFFFYGCIHCFHLHPKLSAWEKTMPKDVQLTYVPTIFRDSWEPMANTFYALELMGKRTPEIDDALFNAWNVDNVDLSDEGKIQAFLARHGVDGKKFSQFYNSFTVETKVMRSKQMQQSYRIMGTPTMIVDGKYVVEAQANPDDTIRILNSAVEQARKDRGGH